MSIRWIILEHASDGQIAGAFGPYSSHARAEAARTALGAAIHEDDMTAEARAILVPIVGGHRELLRQLADMAAEDS